MTDNDPKVVQTEKNPEKTVVEDETTDVSKLPNDWMIKPCLAYWEEYKDCKSFLGRFYQHFYHGEKLNCSQWRTDYNNCQKWENEGDDKAFNDLIASEKQHRFNRLNPHLTNNVWKIRDKPPVDWNEPLPQWMEKQNSSSLLAAKQKAIDEGLDIKDDIHVPKCSIL